MKTDLRIIFALTVHYFGIANSARLMVNHQTSDESATKLKQFLNDSSSSKSPTSTETRIDTEKVTFFDADIHPGTNVTGETETIDRTLREKQKSPSLIDNWVSMLEVLDDMQELMTGERQYNRTFHRHLLQCMEYADPLLAASQDRAWQGVVEYWLMNGTEHDRWGTKNLVYMERNTSYTRQFGVAIYEPCNYASNLAYFHVATELCDRLQQGKQFSFPEKYVKALIKAFSFVTMGSAFMHGAHTDLGKQQDTRAMRVIAFLIHQASLEVLQEYNPILHDMSTEPRLLNSIEYADEFQKMYLYMPVEEWYNHTEYLNPPDYYLSLACVCTSMMVLALDETNLNRFLPSVMSTFGLDNKIKTFINQHYLPEIKKIFRKVQPGFFESARFLGNTMNVAVKFIYAFLWQEEVLTDNPIFRNSFINGIGFTLLPGFNYNAWMLTNFEYSNLDFQAGRNIYPGDAWCNDVIPHAKWHLQSAVGSLDLVYLVDEAHRICARQLII